MASLGFNLPNISGNTLKDEKERKQIMEYLFQLTEQLKYTLTHLDGDNMTDEFKEEIESTEAIQSFERKLQSTDGQLQTILKQTAEGFKLYVKRDDIISAINQSAEMVGIDANKILLEGYVSINGTFSVDEEGYVRCTGGTLGAFTVDGNGAIMGNGSMMIGSMTLDGTTITGMQNAPNLKIAPQNIQEGRYAELTQGSQVLGIDGGEWAFGTPYVTIDGVDYLVNFSWGGYTPPTQTSVSAIRILADNLHKRASASASSDSLGYCQSGELYVGSISGDWAHCTAELTYTANGYTSIPLEMDFYCATKSGSGKAYVEKTTVQLA